MSLVWGSLTLAPIMHACVQYKPNTNTQEIESDRSQTLEWHTWTRKSKGISAWAGRCVVSGNGK